MCEGNEPQSGERIFRRSAAYALLQTRYHGLQPWLHSNAAPRLFGLNQFSSEHSFFRAGSGVPTFFRRSAASEKPRNYSAQLDVMVKCKDTEGTKAREKGSLIARIC